MTLRVATLSTLFPDVARPRFGSFVERQTLELAAHPEVELLVFAPLGLPPWPLSLDRRYYDLRGLPERENWKGLTVHRPRFRHLPGLPDLDPGALARAVLPLLREFPCDVIDAAFFWPDGPAAVALGEALGVPVSIKARGSDIHYWGRKRGAAIVAAGLAAGGMLAVSEALKRYMVALGLPGERIAVHYTGVDLDRFKPVDRALEQHRLGVTAPLVVCPANLIAAKGQALLIEAMTLLPGVTLALIGHGPERARYEDLARRLTVADRVIFTGSLDQAEVAGWIGAANVLALASAAEGLANVWVEALACGTPIVTTDVGGVREVITSAEAGTIVEPTAEAFADAIHAMIKADRDPRTVRKSAERFTWAANTAALYSHLRALTKK